MHVIRKDGMFMNKIVLYDGTEIDGGLAVKNAGTNQLFVSIPGTDITQAAIVFGNQEKTQTIICYSGIYKYTYNGYNQISSIGIDTYENKLHIYLTGSELSNEFEYTVPEEYLPEEMRNNSSVEVNENA